MPEYKILYVKNRAEWREWLAKHHASKPGIWLVYYKLESGRATIPYEDSVEEALCFGWIDSIIKKLDDERYARKFTPRGPGSAWSHSNRRRVAKLMREGRMMPAGLARVDYAHPEIDPEQGGKPPKDIPVPPYFREALIAHGKAWENFENLAPSYRRLYLRWIMDAKRAATRERRVQEAVALLAENRKLGLK